MKNKSLLLVMVITTGLTFNLHAQSEGQKSSPAQLVDALHATFGNHHSRAVHAKGIIYFTPDPHAAELTKAFHLQRTKSKVIVRFSDFTGIPDIPDNSGLANPRGFAIKFQAQNGASTDIVGHSFNGFPTATSDEFRELLLAIAASGNDAPKPTALDNFLVAHPIAKTFLTTQKSPESFATINYYGVNSFKFTNDKGVTHYVRYKFVPENGEQLLTPGQMAASGHEYLMDEINKMAPNTATEDKALFFIPNNIPDGIETADPMLNFRSKAYPISIKERQ